MARWAVILGWLACWTDSLGAQRELPPTRVDWRQLAELVVKRTLKLAPGERVVLFWAQGSDRGAASALRTAIAAEGGLVSAEISVPSAAELEAIQLAPATQAIQKARRDTIWYQAFANADAAIWLPTPLEGLSDRPFEKLVERTRVRSIHFHWFLPSDTADLHPVEAMYARAIAVPPERLQGRISALESALKGASVKLTSPNGTNLRLTIAPNAWVHRNTGDASRAKIASARSVRDREEELPASVFRTTDIAGAEGTIVGYTSFDTRAPVLAATFAGGRVTKLESRKGADAIIAVWQKATGDKGSPAELVIGTNPELPNVLGSGFMPYYGYGSGVVRLAFGDNWESGGKNRSSNGEVLLFIPDATLEANGTVLVKDGKLLVGR